MFVLCPHCQFLVGLESANGLPPERCPRCGLRLQPEAAPDSATPLAASDTTDAIAPATAITGATAPVPVDALAAPDPLSVEGVAIATLVVDANAVVADSDTMDGTGMAIATPVDAAAAPIAVPATPSAPARTHRSPRWPLSVQVRRRLQLASVPALVLLLLLQCLLANRVALAADARWRPLVERACAVLDCVVPAWHEPAAFTLLDRAVRPDPAHPGVLHVTAGFRNDADWPQAWPSLALTLSDADGRVAGSRVFAPDEYLPSLSTQTTMASGQRARVVLDVVEPANAVVAFTFDFR